MNESINTNKVWSIENRTKFFPWFLLVASIISIIFFWSMVRNPAGTEDQKPIISRDNPFNNLELEGKGIIVWDVINNRALYERNSDIPLPLASITKVMTAITAEESGLYNSSVTINDADILQEGDSKLLPNRNWSIKNLLDYALMVSSNDAMHAVASVAMSDTGVINSRQSFISNMNSISRSLGLTSIFLNEHGLDVEAGRSGAYGSPRDVAMIFKYAMEKYPHLLEATRYADLEIRDEQNQIYEAKNTNTATDQIPSLLASKTGYTETAGGNLAIAFDVGIERPIIAVILGSTQEGRFTDMVKLVDASLKYIQTE